MDTRRKKLFCVLGVCVIVIGVFNLFCYRYSSVFDRIGDTSGRTDLHWAARDGRTSAVKKLLAKGADVNCRSKSGYTPLRDAALHGHKKTVEVLIANGADVNARDYPNKTTALHLAAFAGRVEIVKVLLEAGADANAKNRRGATPVDLARNTLENVFIERFFNGKELKACIQVLSEHASSLAQGNSASASATSVTPLPGQISRGGLVVTRTIFLIGIAVCLVGYVWVAVIGFRKDVLWGFGCLFSPINLIFVMQNWDDCRRAFITHTVGFFIALVGFFVGPMLDGLRMMI